jgi:hypothetical protein
VGLRIRTAKEERGIPPKDITHALSNEKTPRELCNGTYGFVELRRQIKKSRRDNGSKDGAVEGKETGIQERSPLPKLGPSKRVIGIIERRLRDEDNCRVAMLSMLQVMEVVTDFGVLVLVHEIFGAGDDLVHVVRECGDEGLLHLGLSAAYLCISPLSPHPPAAFELLQWSSLFPRTKDVTQPRAGSGG